MAALGPRVGENLGMERAEIEIREDGLLHLVRIGDAVAVEVVGVLAAPDSVSPQPVVPDGALAMDA